MCTSPNPYKMYMHMKAQLSVEPNFRYACTNKNKISYDIIQTHTASDFTISKMSNKKCGNTCFLKIACPKIQYRGYSSIKCIYGALEFCMS